MTNGEKYKTTDERGKAHLEFCDTKDCRNCPCSNSNNGQNICNPFRWLDLDAEAEVKPCPFCGGKASAIEVLNYDATAVRCNGCHAQSGNYDTREDAIAAWNRRAG